MTPGYDNREVRDLLFRLLRSPEGARETLLAPERDRRPAIAAAAEQAFAEVMALLDRLPEERGACRAALATGPTLHPLIVEAVDHVLGFREAPLALDPLPPIQPGELLPSYSPELAEGTLFGYYLIERKLSRGGMGVVYLARDTRFADQLVALKLLLDMDVARMDWFRDEAANLYLLAQESNVVGIRDYGTVPAPFIAMEYVEDGSLADALASKTWPKAERERTREAAQLVRTLARTLQAAHVQTRQAAHVGGIFHLDLKPANVLLHEKRGPLLADFSLARRVRHGDDPIGAPPGTLVYSAPEQAAGDPNAKLASIDVYGLGAILYELLTGRPPFVPADGESFAALLQRIQTEEPPRPSELVRDVPSDLEAICLHCLCKKPSERYGSAEKVADDLDAFLRGDKPDVVRWPWRRRTRHFARRQWVGMALSALTAVCVVSIVLFLWYRAEAAEDRTNLAEVEAQLARDSATHAEDMARTDKQHHRQQIRTAALSTAEKGDWKLAMELYDSALRDYAAEDPERLPLEVERLPGWFLYRSRQEVAAELDRLDRVADLAAKERAKVRLYQGDLRLSAEGRTPAVLELLRQSLASAALDKADALYAEALLAPTSRAARAKLSELTASHPGHYRARVAFLGLLLARGELDELRDRLRLHQDRFQGDPTTALLGALLDILQKDDLDAALARIDGARDRLGEERWRKGRAFLTEWARLLRAAARDEVPNPAAILRLKVIVGGDQDVYSLNVPTISWLAEHWGAAAKAFAFSLWGIFRAPEALLAKWQVVCEDSPEATFLVNRAVAEMAVARQAEKQGRKDESLEHCNRAADLSYQAADARTPTLLPRTAWRYKALLIAVVTDVTFLGFRGRAAEPARETRLRDAVRRAVTEGRAHRDFRARHLPQVVAQISSIARTYPLSLSPEVAQVLLIEWMQDDKDNPLPYRLRAKLALEFDQPETALSVVTHWYADKRRPKDAQLDDLRKKAREGVGRWFQTPVSASPKAVVKP